MKPSKRIIFTQGGKGGVGKTELQLSLIPWIRIQGHEPALLDFDVENTNKSGLQNFYPEAEKYDVHKEGALDRFLDICDQSDTSIIIADLGSGAGTAAYQWFEDIYEDAHALGIAFTSIGVTTNEAGAVQSILKWAHHLKDKVDYLIVLNELREPRSEFEYWYKTPAVEEFMQSLSPELMVMRSRIQDLQAALRNRTTTLQQIIDGEVERPFFRKTRNVVRARSYQRDLFEGFDHAASILLPTVAE